MRCKHGYCGEGFDRHCCKLPADGIPAGIILAVVGACLIVILIIFLICCYKKRPEMFRKCLKSYQTATPPQTNLVTRTVHTTVTTHVHHQPQSLVYYPTTTSTTAYTCISPGTQCLYNKDAESVLIQEVKRAPNPSVPSASPPSYEESQRMLT